MKIGDIKVIDERFVSDHPQLLGMNILFLRDLMMDVS